MTRPGGGQWSQMWAAMSAALASAVPPEVRAEEHLATDAIVAFVDGELGLAAHERAARHLARCPSCTAEVAAQRQARKAVRDAGAPAIPRSLLAALHTIPQRAPLPPGPDQLAVTEDGQLVVVQRPVSGRTPLGGAAPLGPLGLPSTTTTDDLDGARRRGTTTRRARQGAGVLVSGLVLGALVLAAPVEQVVPETVPGSPGPGSVGDAGTPSAPELARLDLPRRDSRYDRDGGDDTSRSVPSAPAMTVR